MGPEFQVHSPDANFLYEQPTLSRMTDAYSHSLKSVLEPRTIRGVQDHSGLDQSGYPTNK